MNSDRQVSSTTRELRGGTAALLRVFEETLGLARRIVALYTDDCSTGSLHRTVLSQELQSVRRENMFFESVKKRK